MGEEEFWAGWRMERETSRIGRRGARRRGHGSSSLEGLSACQLSLTGTALQGQVTPARKEPGGDRRRGRRAALRMALSASDGSGEAGRQKGCQLQCLDSGGGINFCYSRSRLVPGEALRRVDRADSVVLGHWPRLCLSPP